MSRTWLITESFPNFCTASNIRSTEKSQICTPNLSHLILHIQLAHYSIPLPTVSNQSITNIFLFFTIKLFHSSHCLESLSNSINGDLFPWYSKLWINCLWLFYLGGHIRTHSHIRQRWDHLEMPWKPRQNPLTGLITVGNRHE